ncbi:G-type lectin S-receptor-like serine/threonine-protein kinase At1g11300 [Camellia sinensis]|uniref:G-type lectin S-receptor-like serine/threonine-protein kinase At1g11300 n=1 Tax=Camellia sinensis TaxID=4442 RepID=UPI001036A5F0|nr:G-type lectin S-receptor-like serine/threonine-protein kinase At1g11300 [Camellia sinensis]
MANTNNTRMTTYAHFVFLLISSCLWLADASTDTILPGQLITDSDTIASAGNVFELGFFSPGNGSSTMNYYVAICISADGNLAIEKGKFLYMLTNISSNGNTSATLLDSGNLVLRDGTSEIAWIDGWMKVGSLALCASMLLPPNTNPWMVLSLAFDLEHDVSIVIGDCEVALCYGQERFLTMVRLTGYGAQYCGLITATGFATLTVAMPALRYQCYPFGFRKSCFERRDIWENPGPGVFSLEFDPQGTTSSSLRRDLKGDVSGGCVRKAPLQCGNDSQANGQSDHDGCSIWSEDLFNVEQLKDDDLDRSDFYLKLSASAFLSEDSRRKRWKWFILALAVSMTLALLYVEEDKVAKQSPCIFDQAGEDLLLFDVGTSIGAANCTLNEASKDLIGGKKEVALPLFSFTSVSSATDNFSDANKLGEAGFGPVYKNTKKINEVPYQGKLLKGYEVAVKRLSRKSGQGLEELQNEAMLIVKLQHKNLVWVRGVVRGSPGRWQALQWPEITGGGEEEVKASLERERLQEYWSPSKLLDRWLVPLNSARSDISPSAVCGLTAGGEQRFMAGRK